MALRDQPYLPLYVQDFMTDEKLSECSAQTTGVYIRLMCLMHKSEQYGVILLKQKDKQTTDQVQNFCLKLAKHFPYSLAIIRESLDELLEEHVIAINGDMLFQKRMVRDDEISRKRACAGNRGGKKAQENRAGFASNFALAKSKANTEYKNENEYEDESSSNETKKTVATKKQKKCFAAPTLEEVQAYAAERNSTAELAKKFFDYYTADPESQWQDKDGQPVKSWKQKFVTWQSREGAATKNTGQKSSNPFLNLLTEGEDG